MAPKGWPFYVQQRPQAEGLDFRPKVNRKSQGWHRVLLSPVLERRSLRDRKTPRAPLWAMTPIVSPGQSSPAHNNLCNLGFKKSAEFPSGRQLIQSNIISDMGGCLKCFHFLLFSYPSLSFSSYKNLVIFAPILT